MVLCFQNQYPQEFLKMVTLGFLACTLLINQPCALQNSNSLPNSFFNKQNIQVKIAQLSSQISKDQNNPFSYYQRGCLYLEINDLDRAESDLKQAKTIDPNEAKYYAKLAHVYLEKKLNKCKEEIEAGLKINPEDIEIIWARAGYYAQNGKADDALSDANFILVKTKGKESSYGKRGLINYMLGRYEDSLADIKREIAEDPIGHSGSYYMYFIHLGKCIKLKKHNLQSELDALKESFLKACEKLKEGSIKLDSNLNAEAIDLFNQSENLYPELFIPTFKKALALLELGKIEDGLKNLDKSIGLCPEYPPPYYYKGFVKLKEGKAEESIGLATNAIQKFNNYSESYNLRGLANDLIGNNKEALEDYLAAYKLDRSTPEIQKNLGRVYFKLGNYSESINYFTRAIQLDKAGDNGTVYIMRSAAYEKMGRMDDKNNDLKMAKKYYKP